MISHASLLSSSWLVILCIVFVPVKSDDCALEEVRQVFGINHIPSNIPNSIANYASENWHWAGQLAGIFTNKIVNLWNFREQILKPKELIEEVSIKQEYFVHRTESCKEVKRTDLTIINYFWLSPPNNPKRVPVKYYDNIKRHMELYRGWSFRIWTNMDVELFMHANRNLTEIGLEVLNLRQLETNRTFLVNEICNFTDYKKRGGLYIDTAKYLVLESRGGIIVDLNFEFSRVLSDQEMCVLDFMADASTLTYIENYFIFSKPQHPILTSALDFISNAIFEPECFVNEILNNCLTDTITDFFSMLALDVSFFKNANRNTVDMLLTKHGKCDLLNKCVLSGVMLSKKHPLKVDEHKLHNQSQPISGEEFHRLHTAWTDYSFCIADSRVLPVGNDNKEHLWRNIDYLQ